MSSMMVGELDEVQYDLEADGEQVRRQLHRKVWERGAWATVAIVYQERAPAGPWKPAKLALIRLQRVRGAWKKHAAITMRGDDARELAGALAAWDATLQGEPGDGEPGDGEPGDDAA